MIGEQKKHFVFKRYEEPPTNHTLYRGYLDRVFLVSRDLTGVNATWLGLSSALGQSEADPAKGAGYMRALNAISALKTTGAEIEDAGDISPPIVKLGVTAGNKVVNLFEQSLNGKSENKDFGEVKNLDKIVSYSKVVIKKIKEILHSGRKVINVGGDHSIAFPTIAAALEHFKGDLGVIWIDAHADINIPKYKGRGSLSGNAHGMPVAHLIGLEGVNPELAGFVSEANRLNPANIIYIGLKDLDLEEVEHLDALGITYFSAENSTTAQLTEICQEIDKLQSRVDYMWCSIDLDALDQTVAPGVCMKNKGGLSYGMITALTQYIGVTTNLVGMDIAEFAPKFDDKDDKTAKLILELIARLLGGSKKRWDETAYLEKPVLAESPRKKLQRRKRVGGG
ncbi:MAG: arginase family protein [Candidatus Gracilibacteria bacterium]